MGCFGTGLVEYQIVFVSELLAFLSGHLSLETQVRLVSNQQNNHFGVRVVPHVVKPSHQVVESLPSRDIVHKQGADAATVVAPCYRSERLLTSCVPNLHFHVSLVL